MLRDAAKTPLLRIRSSTLMVRSAATPSVANHMAMDAPR
jgi:nicotinamide mononucleotide (NMN) deamidase PncC